MTTYNKIMMTIGGLELTAFVLIGFLRCGVIGAGTAIGGALAASIYWLQRINRLEVRLCVALEEIVQLQDARRRPEQALETPDPEPTRSSRSRKRGKSGGERGERTPTPTQPPQS